MEQPGYSIPRPPVAAEGGGRILHSKRTLAQRHPIPRAHHAVQAVEANDAMAAANGTAHATTTHRRDQQKPTHFRALPQRTFTTRGFVKTSFSSCMRSRSAMVSIMKSANRVDNWRHGGSSTSKVDHAATAALGHTSPPPTHRPTPPHSAPPRPADNDTGRLNPPPAIPTQTRACIKQQKPW